MLCLKRICRSGLRKGIKTMLIRMSFSKPVKLLIVILCMGFFVFMMVYNLMHSALWYDEWVEYYISSAEIKNGTMYKMMIKTLQPPLYNIIMHFWLKVNSSLVWFRLFNVVLGTLCGFILYKTLKRLFDFEVAIVSLIIFGCVYQWIYCVQECSEYCLMAFFLFLMIFFYFEINRKYTFKNLIFLILSCVGAIYSQYGSAFIVIPILLVTYLRYSNWKNDRTRFLQVTFTYVVCAILFAIPLYIFYLKVQIENEIGAEILLEKLNCLDFLSVPGNIIGYFLNCRSGKPWIIFWTIISVFLLLGSIYTICNKNIEKVQREFLGLTLVAYILHYILVKLQIYAVSTTGNSAGFYCRYSYFYMPLFCVFIPILVVGLLYAIQIFDYNLNAIVFVVIGMCGTGVFLSVNAVLNNWNKTYDDEFAKIWIEREGWNVDTFLVAHADYGFDYYIGKNVELNSIIDLKKIHRLSNADYIELTDYPEAFWIWSTNDWDGQVFNTIFTNAKEQGYMIDQIRDSGSRGQFCYFER